MFDTAAPYIACFAILRRGTTVAFVKRANTDYMDGYYGLPAGKVEKKESFTAGTIREAAEEAGVTIKPETLQHAITVHRTDGSIDWVDVFFEVANWEGEPYNAEPAKATELTWLDMNNLPDNVVPHVQYALEQLAAGQTYAEYGW